MRLYLKDSFIYKGMEILVKKGVEGLSLDGKINFGEDVKVEIKKINKEKEKVFVKVPGYERIVLIKYDQPPIEWNLSMQQWLDGERDYSPSSPWGRH